MASIYKKSDNTFIWLGPASDDSARAVRAISQYHTAWSTRGDGLRASLVDEAHADEYKPLVDIEFDQPECVANLRAIACFMLRRWWRRAWIVQEAVLSSRLEVVCGPERLSWAWIDDMLCVVRQHATSRRLLLNLPDSEEAVLADPAELLFRAILGAGQRFKRINNILGLTLLPLPHILRTLRTASSHDSRDKVYAGLGMAEKPEWYAVDYTLQTSEVFEATTRALIHGYQDLHALDYCTPSLILGLPSWVVDWSCASNRLPLPKQQVTGKQVYNAGGPQTWISTSDPNGVIHTRMLTFRSEGRSTLVLRGLPVDDISFLGEPTPGIGDVFLADSFPDLEAEVRVRSQQQAAREPTMSSWFRSMLRHIVELDTIEPELRSILGAIMDHDDVSDEWLYDLVRDGIDVEAIETPWFRSLLKEWVIPQRMPELRAVLDDTRLSDILLLYMELKYRHTDQAIKGAFNRTVSLDCFFARSTYLGRSTEFTKQQVKELRRTSTPLHVFSGRTVMVTTSGWMGVVPVEAQVGDLICVVSGQETPYVLRRKAGDRYTFVGECYVHGIMDGEFWLRGGGVGGVAGWPEFRVD